MKKLFYSISTVLILLAFGFIVLAITSNRSFMGTRSVHFKSGEIQEIIIVNGMNLKDVTLTDPDQIESFRNKLNQTKFQKGRKNDSDGWSYVIKVVDTEKKESEFVVLSENKMDMDGMIYEVNEDFMDMAKKVLEEE